MKKSELIFTAIKPPLDYLAIILAGITAYFIRYLPAIQSVRSVSFDLSFKNYVSILSVAGLLWLVIFALSGLYVISSGKKIPEELAKVFVACSAGLALVLAIMVFSRFLFDSRFIILAAWLLSIIFVSAERIFIHLIRNFAYKFNFGVRRAVIVGNGQIAQDLINEFNRYYSLGYRIIRQFLNFDHLTEEEIKKMVAEDKIDEIIQINPNINTEQTINLIDFVNENHLDFRYAADLLGTKLTNLEVMTYAGIPMGEVKKTRLDGWGRISKRIYDLIGSIILIILTLPLMILIALAIKLDSAGPILFRYQRIGQNGKPFIYFKFRSMIKNAHQFRFDRNFLAQHQNLREGTPMIKFDHDPRITRVGKFLRRFSFDELPEFFIVLVGKMSLVGPRPHEAEEVGKYQRHHKKVLTIKPGITGLAQVSGRSDISFEEEVKLDTFYIENWSLGLDGQILLKTPLAV